MPEFASELLRTLVRKKPEQVWEALTATGIPLGYLYGMTVESDWRPGTSVTMTLGDQARLTGDVLAAERPRRLSYTLGDRPGQPSVYVNWELRALGDATIVRLYVDEPWPDADPTDDLEAAWLPVLYDLVAYLDWGAGRFPSDRDLPDPSGLRFATVRIDTAFPTIAHRAGTSHRDIPGHCSGFTVACARAQMSLRHVRFAGLPMPGRTAPVTSPRRARACAAVRARSSSEATGEPVRRHAQPARRLGPWCAVAVIAATRSRWRHLAWLYPTATVLVVLASANHFLLDAAGGLAVLGLGLLGTAGKQRGPCHGHRGAGSRPDPADTQAPPPVTLIGPCRPNQA